MQATAGNAVRRIAHFKRKNANILQSVFKDFCINFCHLYIRFVCPFRVKLHRAIVKVIRFYGRWQAIEINAHAARGEKWYRCDTETAKPLYWLEQAYNTQYSAQYAAPASEEN